MLEYTETLDQAAREWAADGVLCADTMGKMERLGITEEDVIAQADLETITTY